MNLIIKKSRKTKRIRISVHPDGKVIVSAPWIMPDVFVRRFVASKADWIKEKLEYFAKHTIAKSELLPRQRMTLANKKLALDLVQNRLKHFNQFYNFEYKNITIRNQKTRWGSCSRKKNLNFNYKILFLKPEQQDYIVVHELCHLSQMNHGPKFWELVVQQIPDYKNIRASIKKFRL